MTRVTAAFAAVVIFAGVAWGDLSGYTGWTDPTTGMTWEGVAHLSAPDPLAPTQTLAADVEWVVEWDANAGMFHYMYQMTAGGDYAVSILGVPMLFSNEAQDLGWTELNVGEIAPQLTSGMVPLPPAEPTLAKWDFQGLAPGATSTMLDYWSVNKPLLLGGYIQDGGLFAATADMPSPDNEIPEPATMSLLALGAVALLRRRR